MLKQVLTRDQLLTELGIRALPSEAQDEVIGAVGENIMKSVLLAAMLKLPSDAQLTLRQLIDRGDADGVSALLKQHIADPETFVMEEARKELAAYKETLAKKLAQ